MTPTLTIVSLELLADLRFACRDQRIPKGAIAAACGKKPSWTTMLFKGELYTLRPEYVAAIEKLIGRELLGKKPGSVTELSPLAYQFGVLIDTNKDAQAVASLMLQIFTARA